MTKDDTYKYVLEIIYSALGDKYVHGELLLQRLKQDLPQFLPARNVKREERIKTHWLLMSSWAYFNDAQEDGTCLSIENLFYDYYLYIAECLPDMVGKIHYDFRQHLFSPTKEELDAFQNNVVPLLSEMIKGKRHGDRTIIISFPTISDNARKAARYGGLTDIITVEGLPNNETLEKKIRHEH